ncbi:Vacuolar protein sorting-associated protein 54-like [Lachnellula hyalina]|uniref:Vacuolar protein sorting-associated protein 54 n=1 Tax=Lachnellula hyalina TaxID=1316788 RepID=A0A8H8TYB1_9HELO|nr:Vacuolar protein sorting-associated protein 54-like [Lachnellula hyalina]TVY25195.1 Vacuolar protein sorting-associated protein 54-like [Lachnellula hyalina]
MASLTPRQSVDVDSFSSSSPNLFSKSEYPFPRLVALQMARGVVLTVDRPGSSSSNRYQPRRGSTASSIHSIGGTLDTASNWHGLSESGQNAISTLLQPPIVRTGLIPHTSAPASSAHKPPTARDIPPVTLTNIPTVDPSEFKPYLSQVGALYDALQRAKENAEEGGTQLLRKGNQTDDFADLLDPERRLSSRPNLSKRSSLASLASSIETPSVTRRRLSGGKRMIHAPTPLSTIPPVYFEEDFHLENPRTFDVVSERSEVVKPAPGTPDERKAQNGAATGPRKALATNAILQEKLSWYMDTIEVHLIASISTASTSFFAALGELRELHSEAADSVSRIKALRKELKELDEDMAIGGLDIVNKKRRRENIKQLGDAVHQLKRVVETLATCESLVDSGEVEKALDAMDGLEKLIAGEEQGMRSEYGAIQFRDLRGATALQGVTNDLDVLRSRIGKTFESRFLHTLLGDLRRHVESVSNPDILQRWSSASKRSRGGHNREPSIYPSYLAMGEDFRPELQSILNGLHRARHTSPATAAYRESVLREVRNIIRRPLPASNDDDATSMMSTSTIGGGQQKSQQEKSTILARNLRALDPEDAEELLKKVYIGVGETLRRLGFQVKILLDVTSTLGDPSPPAGMKSPPRSPNIAALDGRLKQNSTQQIQEEMHLTLDMSNLLGQAVDIAQDKIVKVLRVRSEQSIHLPVEKFLRYFNLNLLFANECEAVSGRSGTALKNVVNGHIKDFVHQLGDSEKQALATGMETDPWNASDFTDSDKEELSRILSASTQDAEAWSTGSNIWLPPENPPTSTLAVPSSAQTNGTSGTSTPSSTPAKPTIRPAIIEGETFLLPMSAISCLHGISTFLHLNTGIPSMTNEIAASILSYLSTFNSRCTQLILGAGATRSAASLKNITTKHLALAAQAVSFISSLIPHIREFVRRHAGLNTSISNLMGEFDKVRRAYLEHQQSIYDKLVDIMAGRAAAHTKAMKLIDWEIAGKDGVNAYMETLTKETRTLHRVLSNYLPAITVQGIMEPVFKSYKEQLGKSLEDVSLGSEAAQSRMLRDAEHFKARIGGLDGAGDTGDFVVNLVKNKNVPKPKTPSPPPVKEEAATNGTIPTPETSGNGKGGEKANDEKAPE